jgi:hypothetical protein
MTHVAADDAVLHGLVDGAELLSNSGIPPEKPESVFR